MPKCPKCNAEIDYLHEYSEAEVRCRFSLGEEGEIVYQDRQSIGDGFPVIEYECPICKQVICTDTDIAISLLEGEEIIPVEEPVLTVAKDRSALLAK